MAVDTNFKGLLLEKVKGEDPWLPPRTWESIPSQSGTFLSPSSSSSQNRQLLADTSTVSVSSTFYFSAFSFNRLVLRIG